MRLKSQYVFIIAVVAVLVLYFGGRALFSHGDGKAQASSGPSAPALPSVQAQMTPQAVREIEVVMRGRTEAARTVIMRSETAGVVAATPVLQGTPVKQGQVLCRLAVDARQATLDQARAALKSRQLSKDAAVQLAEKGYRSQTQVLQAQADLDAAQAAVRQAEIALTQVEIRAPFDGVFDHRDAQVGAYLAPGQPCGTVVELNPMLVVADAPETEAGKLHVGATAQARLLSGQALAGRVRYVAHDADPQTRTYHLEVEARNPGLSVRSGLSADLRVSAGQGPAHLVPVSALVLDSAGRQGVRYVQADGRVAFAPVNVMEETPQGAWISGLSGTVNIITVGQSFVADGQKVRVAQVNGGRVGALR